MRIVVGWGASSVTRRHTVFGHTVSGTFGRTRGRLIGGYVSCNYSTRLAKYRVSIANRFPLDSDLDADRVPQSRKYDGCSTRVNVRGGGGGANIPPRVPPTKRTRDVCVEIDQRKERRRQTASECR